MEQAGYFFELGKILGERSISLSAIARASDLDVKRVKTVIDAAKPVSSETVRRLVVGINQINFESEDTYPQITFGEAFTSVLEKESPNRSLFSAIGEEIIEDVSPEEFVALGLTNAKVWGNTDESLGFRLLTSKDVYMLLPAISRLLKRDIEDVEFEKKLSEFEAELNGAFSLAFDRLVPSIPNTDQIVASPRKTLGWTGAEAEKANKVLTDLHRKGLIVDPIVEPVAAVSIAVLGLVPTSFTKRTEEGDLKYRKVSAVLWEYEYLNEGDEKETRKFHFRAEKAVEALKRAVAGAHQLLNERNQN